MCARPRARETVAREREGRERGRAVVGGGLVIIDAPSSSRGVIDARACRTREMKRVRSPCASVGRRSSARSSRSRRENGASAPRAGRRRDAATGERTTIGSRDERVVRIERCERTRVVYTRAVGVVRFEGVAADRARGGVGAVAQWLKLSKCGESLRYSTVCRYSFAIDAHLLVGFVISFLLVFRSLQAFRRYEEAKEALIAVKESLRNVVGTVETEGENAEGMREAMKRRRASMANGGYQDELRRLCNLAYAFMRQGLRESRFGVRAPHGGEIPDVSDDGLLNRDEDGTPSLSKLATEAERVQYAQIPVVSRPEAVMVNALSLVEIAALAEARSATAPPCRRFVRRNARSTPTGRRTSY